MDDINGFLWLLPVLAQLAVLVRIASSRKAPRYPILFLFLVALVTIGSIGNLAHGLFSRNAYSTFWVSACVASWSLAALALTEVSTRSIESYERFSAIGNRVIQTVLVASGLVILGSLFVAPASWNEQFLQYFQAQGYLVQGSLALLGLSVLTFVWAAGLKLHVNARSAMKAITVFCAGEAVLGAGISAEWPSTAFYVGISWSTVCWGSLALVWKNRPESANVGPRRPLDEKAAASMLANMESASRGLTGMIRRG